MRSYARSAALSCGASVESRPRCFLRGVANSGERLTPLPPFLRGATNSARPWPRLLTVGHVEPVEVPQPFEPHPFDLG
jgi:hypothetical protein